MNSNQNPLDHPSIDADEARIEFFDANFPGWDTRDDLVSENDFPVYDATADAGLVPNEDWDAMGEDFFFNPIDSGMYDDDPSPYSGDYSEM